MKDRTVLQAKRYDVYSCPRQCSLLGAARLMVSEDISALVVVDDEGYLAGIITRTDILRTYRLHEDWATQPVEKHMSRDVVTVTPTDRLGHVVDLLLDKAIHRVVAVKEEDGRKRPVMVISASDLVYYLVKET